MTLRPLNDKLCASLDAPDGRRLDVRDGKVRGLVLRVSPDGGKAWSVLYRRKIDGRRRRATLGAYPAVGLADARSAALDVLARVSKGGDPAGEKNRATAGQPVTFGDLCTRYLESYAEQHKRSGHQDRQMLEKDALPVLRTRALVTLKRADIADVIQRVVARGSPIQANRLFEVVRGAFNWGMGAGLIETTPCIGLKAPSPEASRDRTLTDDEIRQLWEGLEAAKMSWAVAQALRILLVTGQRVSEVIGARRSELALDRKEWRLPAERVKNASPHEVPLSDLALSLFEEALARSKSKTLVFPSAITGSPIAGHSVAKALKRSLQGLRLADFTPHDLRRTCATNLAKAGIPRLIVDKTLNHISADRSTIAGVYDRHSYWREKTEALDLWAANLSAILAGQHPGRNVIPLRRTG
jgi:integrase